jgi:hypothetical protein
MVFLKKIYWRIFTLFIIFLVLNVSISPVTSENKKNKLGQNQFGGEETHYYAIIASCTQYENKKYNIPKPPLRPIPNDKLLYIYNVLIDSTNWHDDHIILLLNENATKQNIITAFAMMSEKVTSKDIFLFCWFGHGSCIKDKDGDESIINPKDTYDEVICPYDTEKIQDELVNVISDDELDAYLSNISAKGMCIIFESCLSGGLIEIKKTILTKGRLEIDEQFNPNHNVFDVNGENRVVIMSTFSNTICTINFRLGPALMHSLANALNNQVNDRDNDGYISIEEAFQKAKISYRLKSSELMIFLWFLMFFGYYLIVYYPNIIFKIHYIKRIYDFLLNSPFIGNFYTSYINLFTKYPLLTTTNVILLTHISQQLLSYSINDHFFLNMAHIKDDFHGELPIIKKL